MRNSKVIDIVRELESYGVKSLVWDPVADPKEAYHEYGIELVDIDKTESVDAIVAAVAHREITSFDLAKLASKAGSKAPFIDVKMAFDRKKLAEAGFEVWRL